jgi:hypothetical protein
VGWRDTARGNLRAYLRRQATDGVHRRWALRLYLVVKSQQRDRAMAENRQ